MLRESVHHHHGGATASSGGGGGGGDASLSSNGWFSRATSGWFGAREDGSPPPSPHGDERMQEREALIVAEGSNDARESSSPRQLNREHGRGRSRGCFDGRMTFLTDEEHAWSSEGSSPREGGGGGGGGEGRGNFFSSTSLALTSSTPYGLFIRRIRWTRVPPEALLLMTAAIWGTYHPCMRMMLTGGGAKPTPSEINLARFAITASMCVAHHFIVQWWGPGL